MCKRPAFGGLALVWVAVHVDLKICGERCWSFWRKGVFAGWTRAHLIVVAEKRRENAKIDSARQYVRASSRGESELVRVGGLTWWTPLTLRICGTDGGTGGGGRIIS